MCIYEIATNKNVVNLNFCLESNKIIIMKVIVIIILRRTRYTCLPVVSKTVCYFKME